MTERKLSELQKEYRDFFLGKLKHFGVKSPAELTKEKKSEFFTSIKQDWAKIKEAKKQTSPSGQKTSDENLENGDDDIESKHSTSPKKSNNPHLDAEGNYIEGVTLPEKTSTEYPDKKTNKRRQQAEHQTYSDFSKQIIKSKPNEEQSDDLKILYTPNSHFKQEKNYHYPVVKMPKVNSPLKLPRVGRSNQKGYKEDDFYNEIREQITDIELSNDFHMVIPNYNKPYEPDIILYDKKLNLYIDIEIDEPYDGYFRYPTHCIKQEEEQKQDDIRDLFFTESGWVAVRFTEKQVHLQSNECIDYIKNVLNSIYNRNFLSKASCEIENQWDDNQCIKWQKEHYREKYLGIAHFFKRRSFKEIEIDTDIDESIEKVIERTKKFDFASWSSSVAFDEETHKYIHPKDETGNAEFISVTTLIERFFPFDLKRYCEKKAKDENRTEEDILIEYLMIRDEASEKGTFLHNQIEKFLKEDEFDSDTKEFQLFLSFYNKEIKKRNLLFFDAEKMIISKKYNVAGTIDCLFKKKDKDEHVMLDWKRSKKLIVDGYPKKYGFGFALSELSDIDNSSYYRYCLQQNIYKHIVEQEYSIKISSMQLVVLHENYSDYHVVKVPEMKKETNIILNSLTHKI